MFVESPYLIFSKIEVRLDHVDTFEKEEMLNLCEQKNEK